MKTREQPLFSPIPRKGIEFFLCKVHARAKQQEIDRDIARLYYCIKSMHACPSPFLRTDKVVCIDC